MQSTCFLFTFQNTLAQVLQIVTSKQCLHRAVAKMMPDIVFIFAIIY